MTRALLLAAVAPAFAHVMSMSTGDLAINGARAHYELRIPLYEVTHVANPEKTLLEHIRFSGATLEAKSCRADSASESYICVADYRFAKPPADLDVECTLHAVTVPNHVHLLHTTMGGKREETVFDSGLTRATLRFRDPGAAEAVVTQAMSGALRIVSTPTQWLFLIAVVLAARSRRELQFMAAALVAGQLIALLVLPLLDWQPNPRFADAAAALTVAYLAVEILLLPKSGNRWPLCIILGMVQALPLHLFVQNAHYHAALVWIGAAVAQVAITAALAWIAARVPAPQARRPVSAGLALFGLAAFFLALR